MSLEKYIESLSAPGVEGEGEFTLSATRARELLAERALEDKWMAWLCVLQGFYSLGAQGVLIDIKGRLVKIRVVFSHSKSLKQLAGNQRFLLGWLNLDWFGEASWDSGNSELCIELKGSVWTRYRTASVLQDLFRKQLSFAPCPTILNGKTLVPDSRYTSARSFTLLRGAKDCPDSLLKSEGVAKQVLSTFSGLRTEHCRTVWLVESCQNPEAGYSAIAYKSKQSWSQARWVSHGVLIMEERNTLERPGLSVIASVQSLNLQTDLSGFSIVHDEAYFNFVNRLKKEVLWML